MADNQRIRKKLACDEKWMIWLRWGSADSSGSVARRTLLFPF
jgi:hypothetical protein